MEQPLLPLSPPDRPGAVSRCDGMSKPFRLRKFFSSYSDARQRLAGGGKAIGCGGGMKALRPRMPPPRPIAWRGGNRQGFPHRATAASWGKVGGKAASVDPVGNRTDAGPRYPRQGIGAAARVDRAAGMLSAEIVPLVCGGCWSLPGRCEMHGLARSPLSTGRADCLASPIPDRRWLQPGASRQAGGCGRTRLSGQAWIAG